MSTSNQKTERQLTKRNNFDHVYVDVISGSVPFAERPEAQKFLDSKAIKHITINEITRSGRNLSDIINTLQHFTARKINIHIENLGLDNKKNFNLLSFQEIN
ncbi:recombinase family protein [Psychroflexus aestuariivivens]|uniref:recombinase family protein n=1 Tax=Psychroflexus aestuariivivens TaxID=1795040 RepID=UPI000FDC7116